MRLLLLGCSLLLLPTPALALCRCTCVEGVSRPICQPTDLMVPLCQDLCLDSVQPERVTRPLAGGRPATEPIQPFNPAPGGLSDPQQNLDTDVSGLPLGTSSTLSGNVGGLSGGGGR